jgi:hypothetical protein
MGLFRRSRSADDDSAAPDETFEFLTRRQAARVRELAQQGYAELGVETVIGPDHLVGADGTVYGLANLMAACLNADRGERSWPALVRRHCHSLVQAMADTVDATELPVEEVLERVYLRVVGVSTLPDEWRDRYRYGRLITDELVELLFLDSPQSLRSLRQEEVDAFGADVLRQAGLENLLREPVDAVESFDCGEGAVASVVLGGSVYTASRILALPDLLRRVYGERSYPDGVVVGVPFRHQVVLHPVDSRAVVPAIQRMADFVHAGFADGVGSVSPYLFWWWGGQLRQLTFPGEDGGLLVRCDEDLTAVLNRLFED